MDWLLYNNPLSYAQLVLDGNLENYLKRVSGGDSVDLENY